ncbi:hypothetical protein C671_3382 [[Clostridium] bifermentans ATCC 19299]|uniref:hypothetical protein n=1 Tax=Paraclostridium bifermentans TaxID=1490 RepID=UPI00038D8C7D|nr:hypothetical protein [Paraclostridium bifermentans]EQK38332.1 hypothetical protein C671_3382 [[Clostridium] bifermentans ATCC 19299] [Paraclostridium bifermentans ATCC 19299]
MVLKKYINVLIILIALLIVFIVGIQLNLNLSKHIENNIPFKSKLFDSKSESETDTQSVDNKIIDRRYKMLNKNALTYKVPKKNLKENCFFEFENGFTPKDNAFLDSKPINNEKYGQILLGYSYYDLDKSFTKDEAISKVKSILPDNSKEVYNTKFGKYELIKYKTDNDTFIAIFGYKKTVSKQSPFPRILYDYDENKIQSIEYFKVIK